MLLKITACVNLQDDNTVYQTWITTISISFTFVKSGFLSHTTESMNAVNNKLWLGNLGASWGSQL